MQELGDRLDATKWQLSPESPCVLQPLPLRALELAHDVPVLVWPEPREQLRVESLLEQQLGTKRDPLPHKPYRPLTYPFAPERAWQAGVLPHLKWPELPV